MKFVGGAAIDAGAQVAVSMTQGENINEAIRNIDGTQVLASGAISTVLAPGVSTGAKVTVAGAAITMDAAVDYSIAQGTNSIIDGTKTVEKVAQDGATSVITLKAGNIIKSGMSDAIQSSVKADVKTIKSLGSGIGNKNVINNTVRDKNIKEVTDFGKNLESIMYFGVDLYSSSVSKYTTTEKKKEPNNYVEID